MSDKKQLNEEELEKVSGGAIGTDNPEFYGFSGYLDMYSLTVGNEYYFVEPAGCDNVHWLRGKLSESYEDHNIFNYTTRKHKVEIKELGWSCSWNVGETVELKGKEWAVYTTKN